MDSLVRYAGATSRHNGRLEAEQRPLTPAQREPPSAAISGELAAVVEVFLATGDLRRWFGRVSCSSEHEKGQRRPQVAAGAGIPAVIISG